MRGVDLSRYRFDTGLTFSALVMHADGTTYHRYGGRDHSSAGVWLGEESYAAFLTAGLERHAEYSEAPDPPTFDPPVRLEDVPSFVVKDKGKCIHCHSVRSAFADEARAAKTWNLEDAFVCPPPRRIGIEVAPVVQNRITAVAEGSPAALAGLAVGDELVALANQPVLTATDVSWVLDGLPTAGSTVALEYVRAGEKRTGELVLAPGWKAPLPLEYSWRPHKWDLDPRVGFGGRDLSAEDKEALGLEPGAFAFTVKYIVAKDLYGPAARSAGIKKGDVVVSAGGRSDFENQGELHAWWCFEHEPGDTVEVELLRGGERKTVRIVVPG